MVAPSSSNNMFAQLDAAGRSEEFAEPRLALFEGQLALILAIELERVERIQDHLAIIFARGMVVEDELDRGRGRRRRAA